MRLNARAKLANAAVDFAEECARRFIPTTLSHRAEVDPEDSVISP